MFEKLTIRGETASLLWAYRTAATLSAWKITKDQQRLKLTATVTQIDAFTVNQRPLLFEAKHGGGKSRWLVDELQFTHGTLTATLGPPVQ
jgi:hypothetical protein